MSIGDNRNNGNTLTIKYFSPETIGQSTHVLLIGTVSQVGEIVHGHFVISNNLSRWYMCFEGETTWIWKGF